MMTLVPRAAATLSAGALAAHELQALITYRGDVQQALSHQGHSYLAVVTPILGALLGIGLTWLLLTLAGVRRSNGRCALPRRRVWLAASGALLTISIGQELLEGWLASGHSEGLEGVLGQGGLVALAVAGGVGGLMAFMLGAVATAAALRPAVRPPRPRLVARPIVRTAAPGPVVRLTRGLARPQAGRAPPGLLSI